MKQKLPGVYVQPSYRSALSKFKFNFENLNNFMFWNSSAQENFLTCSVVWSDIHKTRAVPGWCVQIYSLYSWQLPWWRLPGKWLWLLCLGFFFCSAASGLALCYSQCNSWLLTSLNWFCLVGWACLWCILYVSPIINGGSLLLLLLMLVQSLIHWSIKQSSSSLLQLSSCCFLAKEVQV